jgi:hypothetical protein
MTLHAHGVQVLGKTQKIRLEFCAALAPLGYHACANPSKFLLAPFEKAARSFSAFFLRAAWGLFRVRESSKTTPEPGWSLRKYFVLESFLKFDIRLSVRPLPIL